MGSEAAVERRKYQRHPLSTSISFYYEPARKDFPGRCIDISEGGLLMYVPATTPLQVGHSIRLTVGSVNRPEFSGLSEKPIDASVVRVERQTLLTVGHVAVGVRFAGK